MPPEVMPVLRAEAVVLQGNLDNVYLTVHLPREAESSRLALGCLSHLH